jgi:hypothetical protein
MDFIRKCTVQNVLAIEGLFRDVPKPTCDAEKYKSVNDIERVHEEQTAEAVKKLLVKKPARLIYSDTFENIIKGYGFKLPASKNDMIERGARHHNCVATYADRHCMYPSIGTHYGYMYVRLVFNADATAELNFHVKHDLIVAVLCPQYKGKYNKDLEEPIELTQLRIALTGLPIGILDVRQEVQSDKD